MTITCVLCSRRFTSLLIPPEQALQQLQPQIDEHIKGKHVKEVQKIQVAVQRILYLSAWYLAVTQILNVPDDESYLQGLIQKHQDEIMRLLGFDKTVEIDDIPDDEGEPDKEGADVIPIDKLTSK